MALSTIFCRRSNKPLASGLGQQIFSAAFYLGAIPVAYVSPYIAIGMIVLVALRWLVPPKKIVQLTHGHQ
jgi:hypothetical protein